MAHCADIRRNVGDALDAIELRRGGSALGRHLRRCRSCSAFSLGMVEAARILVSIRVPDPPPSLRRRIWASIEKEFA